MGKVPITAEIIRKYLMETKREGITDLLDYMNEIGFLTAPCSGGNHLCKEGGLAEHSVNVLMTAEKMGVVLYGGEKYNEIHDSIAIAALLHDLGKCGQFGKSEYVPNILKDGKPSKAKPYERNKELLKVPHEIRSVALATMYIDLTEEEQHAILYHNGLYGPLKYEIQGNETPLYMLIHWADMWASRVIEKEES